MRKLALVSGTLLLPASTILALRLQRAVVAGR